MLGNASVSQTAAQLSKPEPQHDAAFCQPPGKVAQPAGFLYPPCLQLPAPLCPALEHDGHLVGLVVVGVGQMGAMQGQVECRFPLETQELDSDCALSVGLCSPQSSGTEVGGGLGGKWGEESWLGPFVLGVPHPGFGRFSKQNGYTL